MTERTRALSSTGVRTALITNSGTEAGRACAVYLARKGFRIIAADADARTVGLTAAAVSAAGSDCTPALIARGTASEWDEALRSIARTHGGVDLMVNIFDTPAQRQLFELTAPDCAPIDVHELVAACRAVAIHWVQQVRSGRIITILPERAATTGAISAGAVATATMFTECLHLEIRKHGCSASAVLARSADADAVVAALAAAEQKAPPIRRGSITVFPLPGLPLRPRRDTPAPQLVVITGAGSGIGRATAQRFARAGSTVIASDIDRAAAEKVVDDIRASGGHAHAYLLDVTDVGAFEEFAAQVRHEHGTPDLVVNNAGIAILGEIVDSSPEDWPRVSRINLVGMVHGTRLFGAQMAEAMIPGRIVNVSSAAAFLPISSLASYSATKAGVRAFTDRAADELNQHGIRTSVICPGPIATNIFASTAHAGVDGTTRAASTRALFDRAASLHIIPGADVVARAVEAAVARDIATVLVRPEAYCVYALRALAPGILRNISAAICNKRTITMMYRVARTGIVAKALHNPRTSTQERNH